MAAIFSLVLEFFLNSQLENARDLKVEKQYMTAQIMYSVAKQKQAKCIKFDKGSVETSDNRVYTVQFPDGKKYIFGN
ncbi:hypothetical protein [Lactovum odontotermitis]